MDLSYLQSFPMLLELSLAHTCPSKCCWTRTATDDSHSWEMAHRAGTMKKKVKFFLCQEQISLLGKGARCCRLSSRSSKGPVVPPVSSWWMMLNLFPSLILSYFYFLLIYHTDKRQFISFPKVGWLFSSYISTVLPFFLEESKHIPNLSL